MSLPELVYSRHTLTFRPRPRLPHGVVNMSRSRNWVFTLNNPGPDDKPEEWGDVKYGIYQHEKGMNGTPHLQGYVLLTNSKSLSAMKKLHPSCHFEKRRGSHEQAKAYCSKMESRADEDADPVEWGDEPAQGKRNDLDDIKLMIDGGATEVEIADEHFGSFIRYNRGFKLYMTLTRPQRDWPTFTTVLWGPPGTGKTMRALAEAGPKAYWLPKPCGTSLWFDGYDGQEHVVIDEYFGWIKRDLLCRMCDRYPLLVETKGGTTSFVPKHIWITSNDHPRDWYRKVGLGAMTRRLAAPLGEIIELDEVLRVDEVDNPELAYDSDLDDLQANAASTLVELEGALANMDAGPNFQRHSKN